MARNCAAAGGVQVFLSDQIKKLWADVGFIPTTFELDEADRQLMMPSRQPKMQLF